MYLPDIEHPLSKDEYEVYKVCKQYDDRLLFKRHPENGDYVIFVYTDMSDGMPRLKPVLGFGKTLPTPDHVRKTIYEADTWRHGDRILREMDARKAAYDRNSAMIREAAAAETAEKLEHAVRSRGDSPVIKSLGKRGGDHNGVWRD